MTHQDECPAINDLTALLTATGIGPDGKRSILGCSVQLSEAEPHWRSFLQRLVERGMRGVKLVVSDDHGRLKAARQAVLTGVPWQRCQFHLMRNAMALAPKVAMRPEIAGDLRRVFDADEPAEADRRLREVVTRHRKAAPQLAAWLEENVPEALTALRLPAAHRRRLRTTNGLKRLNKKFWSMRAHYHGQTWNAAELGRALAVNESTVRRYLDLMTGVFMVRQLPPWHENLGKRQVKAPEVYVRDSGLLHALLGISRQKDLEHHPKVGASWEGYAIEEILKALRPDEAYYWATHQGAKLDLLLFKDGRRIGIECKRTDAPTLSPSMRIALTDLKLGTLLVAYPGTKRYSLADEVEVCRCQSW